MSLSTRNVVTGSNTNSFASATTRTQSYTVGSGTELLVVAVRFEGGTLSAQSVSGVRWADSGGANDEALTKVLERESATGTGVHVSWWYLVSPTARAGLVEIDYGVTSGNNNSQSWTIAEVIGGVDTAAPVGASGSASGNAGTASANAALSLTSTVAASLILSTVAHYEGNKNPYTPAAGITAELADGETGNTTNSDHSYWAGEALTTTTGSYAVGATAAASHAFSVAAFEVLPTTGSAQTLTPSLFTNSNTFYAPTVSGTYTLSPGLYTDSDTFYSPTVSTSYSITPGLYTDPDTFYSPAVSATYTLTPGLYDDGDTFYTHVVSLGGSQTLVPGLYVDSDTFYSPTVSSTYTLTPALYADPDTFYSATISSTYVIAPTLYVDPDTFYAATVGSFGGPQTLLPSLYVDPDTFYVHTIIGGLGSGVGQRTRYITVEFYDSGDMWRTNIARDILEYSTQPSKIAFSYMSPQDTIAYSLSTDKIHYTRWQVMGSIQRRSAFKKVFVAPPPPPPPPTDPYFSNVVALLHMDGTDASTTFTDVKGNTFTPAGNAQIDTSQSKFGGASGLFDGGGDYFTSGTITGMPLGTGDFTVEFFVRPSIVGSGYAGLLATPSPSGYVGGGLYIRRAGGTIEVLMNGNSTPVAMASAAWAANVWIHVAVTRESGSVRLFIDGVLQGSATTNTTSLTGTTVSFGYSTQDSGSYNGWADELRITKGVARYTANFTPPTEPFLDL